MRAKRYRKASRKSSSHEDEEPPDELLYCICRSSRGDGFMIACDNCEEWFHGECVNVTAKQSDSIKSYYCQACRDENPALRVIYRNENASSRKNPGSRQKPTEVPSNAIDEIDNHNDRFNTNQSRKRSRKTARQPPSKSRRVTEASANQFADFSDGEFEMDHSQIASPSSSYSQSHPGPYPPRSKYERATPSNLDSIDHVDFHHSQQIRRLPFTRNGRYSAPCGECESCKTRGNCGSCDVCRSPKFKQGRSRQYCVTRMKMCQANDIEYAQSWRNPSPRGRLGPPCGECGSCKTKSNCGTCEFCRNPRAKQTRNRQFCLYKAKMCLVNCATSPPRQSSRYPSACHGDLHDIEFDPTFDEDFGQSRYLSTTRKIQGVVGSKMRRGDHLPGGRYSNDLSSVYPSRRSGTAHHSDFFIDNDFPDAFGISPSTYRNGSSRFSGPHGELEPRLLRGGRGVVDASADALRSIEGAFDSDEDVVLPEMNACAGPACSKPVLHGKYCSQDCRLRHESDNMNRTHSRYPNAASKDQVVTPYGLPYMDHIYCRHHRMLGAQQQQQVFNADIQMGLQQQDIYPDVYTNFGGNQSGIIDYTYDPLAVSSQPSYNRRMPVSDDFLSLGNHHILHRGGSSVVSHSRKFTGAQSSLVGGSRMITLSGRRQVRSGGSGVVASSDVLSPPVPLESITPTMQSLRMYNGHPAIEFPSGDTESATAAEILTAAEAGDLMGTVVDGSSSAGVGGNGVDGTIASSTSTAATVGAVPAFRQGEEYYMMNENENIEINWPSSPSGAPTASASTS